MKIKHEQEQSVFLTLKVQREELFNEQHALDQERKNNGDPITTVQGVPVIPYLDFSTVKEGKGQGEHIVSLLNRHSHCEPLVITIGDERIRSDHSQANLTQAYYAEHLATYVMEVKVPSTVKIMRNGGLHKNACILPQGFQIDPSKVVGLWLESRVPDYEGIVFLHPNVRTLEAQEVAFWEDQTTADKWWYQCGPNGQALVIDFDNLNTTEDMKITVRYHLKNLQERSVRYQNAFPMMHPTRCGKVVREVQSVLLENAIADGQLPEDLGLTFRFPRLIQMGATHGLDLEIKALEELCTELEHNRFKIKSKKDFLDWYGKFETALSLCQLSGDYKFRKILDKLNPMLQAFLDVNRRFCRAYDNYLAPLFNACEAFGSAIELGELDIEGLLDEDRQIASIYLKNRLGAGKPKAGQKAVKHTIFGYEELEAFDVNEQLQQIFSSATSHAELMNQLEAFLTARWDRIKNSCLAYPLRSANDSISLTCQGLARMVFNYRNKEKNIYQYLMPTIKECYDAVTDLTLSELKLNQFVLDENSEYGFNLQTLYDHHSNANGDPQAMQLTLNNPYIPYDLAVEPVLISDAAFFKMIYHSKESVAYHEAYEEWRASMLEDHGVNFGAALKTLADGLRRGSVKGSGSEFDAGPEAIEAIKTFNDYLEALASVDREAILKLNLRNAGYSNQSFGEIWDILTQRNRTALSCVKILSDKITALIETPTYRDFLFGKSVESKHQVFEETAKIFQKAFECNGFHQLQQPLSTAVEQYFDLIVKHQNKIAPQQVLAMLQDLSPPAACQLPSRSLVRHLISVLASNPEADLRQEVEKFNNTGTISFSQMIKAGLWTETQDAPAEALPKPGSTDSTYGIQ